MARSLVVMNTITVVLMLLMFGSPEFAQSSKFQCIDNLKQGRCARNNSTGKLDKRQAKCCSAIKDEIMNDKVCMCDAFDSDVNGTQQLLTRCDINFNVTTCPVSTPPAPVTAPPPPVIDSPAPDYSTSPPYGSESDYSTSPPYGSESESNSSVIVIAVVISIVVIVVIIIVVFCICICKRRHPKTNPNDSSNIPGNGYNSTPGPRVVIDLQPLTPNPMHKVAYASTTRNTDDLKTSESLQYELSTLEVATNDFSKDNVIGQGGFGFVYKGTLTNGSEIAIKRLSNGSGQGVKEFKAEIELLAKLQHKNLVRLLGFCIAEDEALLVYELVPNKSLDYFLFDSKKRQELPWLIRFDIIRGIARGILYLHEDAPQRTVHRDLKAANVLLDAKMAPKIADFGLARICSLEQTHVDATRVVGTRGYMAPEYLLYGQFSTKSDVYAFGVLVLEIISGRRIGSIFNHLPGLPRESLMIYAWRCWGEEKPLELMDPLIKDLFSSEEVVKCIHLGLLCVQDDSSVRPDMSTINHMLSAYTDSATFPEPQLPGLVLDNISSQSTTTSTATQSVTTSSGAVTSPYYQNSVDSRTEDSNQMYF